MQIWPRVNLGKMCLKFLDHWLAEFGCFDYLMIFNPLVSVNMYCSLDLR